MFYFLSPPSERQYTGGHLYNQKIKSYFKGNSNFTVIDSNPGELSDHINQISKNNKEITLIWDSLYLDHKEIFTKLKKNCPNIKQVPLLHYLPSMTDNTYEPEYEFLNQISTKIIVTSQYMQDMLKSHIKCPIHVCKPGIEDLFLRFNRIKDNSTNNKVRFLTVANFDSSWNRSKGHIDILESLNHINSKNWHWEIIGDTQTDIELFEKFKKKAAQYNLHKNITIFGKCPPNEVFLAYQEADALIHFANWESYGMVYAEAMAFNLPIITSAVGESPHLVEHKISGYLLNNKNELSQALENFISSPDLRKKMTLETAKRKHKINTWENTYSGFKNVLFTAEAVQ